MLLPFTQEITGSNPVGGIARSSIAAGVFVGHAALADADTGVDGSQMEAPDLSQAGFRGDLETRTICPRVRRFSRDATSREVPH